MESYLMKRIINIKKTLNLWQIKNKITIFKTSALSKTAPLALVTAIPKATILELKKIQKEFVWSCGTPKIKHSTLCRSCENAELKVGISSKIINC